MAHATSFHSALNQDLNLFYNCPVVSKCMFVARCYLIQPYSVIVILKNIAAFSLANVMPSRTCLTLQRNLSPRLNWSRIKLLQDPTAAMMMLGCSWHQLTSIIMNKAILIFSLHLSWMCSLHEAEILKVITKQLISFKISMVMHMHRRETCTDKAKSKPSNLLSLCLFWLFCPQSEYLPKLKMLHLNK